MFYIYFNVAKILHQVLSNHFILKEMPIEAPESIRLGTKQEIKFSILKDLQRNILIHERKRPVEDR